MKKFWFIGIISILIVIAYLFATGEVNNHDNFRIYHDHYIKVKYY